MEYSNKIRRLHQIKLNDKVLKRQIFNIPPSRKPHFIFISIPPIHYSENSFILYRSCLPSSDTFLKSNNILLSTKKSLLKNLLITDLLPEIAEN